MSRLYRYKIKIRFSKENPSLKDRDDILVPFSKNVAEQDIFSFKTKNAIKIEAIRTRKIQDRIEAIFGNGNPIHLQILKSIILYCMTCDRCVKVKNIIMTCKRNNGKTYNYQEVKKFKQPFPERTHEIKPLPVEVLLDKMAHNPIDYTYRIAMSYLLREQYSLHPNHKFECLWRAYNCMFRFLTSESNDSPGIKKMILHVEQHQDKYMETLHYADAVDLSDGMFKFKHFFETRISRSRNVDCDDFIQFVNIFTNSEILAVFNNNIDVINCSIDVKTASNVALATTIKNTISTYISTTTEDASKKVLEKFKFLLWYAYYLRNMQFHAVIKEPSFSLYSIRKDKHTMCINGFLEAFLYEIFQDDTSF